MQVDHPFPVEERLADVEQRVQYLLYENRRMASILRHVAAPMLPSLPMVSETLSSFDFQWDKIPQGRFMLENAQFRADAPGYVCEFTSLPREWFPGKKVVDVGCGQGRHSWALCKLGATVLSLDQSEHGLDRTRNACRDFPGHRVAMLNILEPLAIDEQFDLVWSFGVLHHTGDTYRAFRNIVPLVKPGGLLFLMIDGEPREDTKSDYATVNEYELWREKTGNLTMERKLVAIARAMKEGRFAVGGAEHIHGYFDAISPKINDLYSWREIEGWLLGAGFEDIKRTVDTRNHHIIAQRKQGS